MIDYRVDLPAPHTHRFSVTLRIAKPAARQQLSLPVWIPGSYLVREFARHLSPLTATCGQQAVAVRALDKATWELDCEAGKPVTVRYEVYAFDTSVRAAFLDSRRGFFNGTSVFLRVAGQEHVPHRVHLPRGPKGWQVATSLPSLKTDAQGWGQYEATDYDALVDHPVELGDFWSSEFSVRGVRHRLVVAGAPVDFDGDKLLQDTRQICEAQIAFWHGRRKVPFSQYVFLLNAVEDGYGGLEHRASTALICARKDLPRAGRKPDKEAYTTLLGLISHEYFHTWNVKRLKPVEFAPYDYTQENHTRMLWFFEGFTSYYDDQFLLRTGLIDAPAYLKLLAKTINQVHATPGRRSYSVAQASFDAWTRYYRQDENTANATVSYYTQGSLVALCLDLTLRQLPAVNGGQPTLDGVMQRLWALQRPIRAEDVAQALADEAGALPDGHASADDAARFEAWRALLHSWTETTETLPLQAKLAQIGVRWHSKAAPLPQRLGVRLSEQNKSVTVKSVMRDSVAEAAGLSAGDEILALDGWRVRRTDDLLQWHRAGTKQTLLLSRDGRIEQLSLPPLADDATGDDGLVIALDAPAANTLPPSQQQARQQWLRV